MRKILNFYIEGFKNLSWGKPLWILIVVKLVFLFLIMRLIFFKPTLSGMTDEQKSEHVAGELAGETEHAPSVQQHISQGDARPCVSTEN